MPQSHCQESTPEHGLIDNSSWIGGGSWSFWKIPVNSNSVLLIHGTSADQHKRFEMFKSFMFPMRILFILGYAHRKRVVVFFLKHPTCRILVVITV